MGFLMHDILAMDILQVLKGAHTDETGLRNMLRAAADPSTARTQTHHMVIRFMVFLFQMVIGTFIY